eukprot:2183325-Rhodomonas_salina.6
MRSPVLTYAMRLRLAGKASSVAPLSCPMHLLRDVRYWLLYAYALDMRCPVLAKRIVMPGTDVAYGTT